MARHSTRVCPTNPARRKPRYSSPLTKKRGLLRTILTTRLRELTNEPRARMWYNAHDFWRHVVHKHSYKLAGWPATIPFTNFSDLKGGRTPIDNLLHLWNTGELTFVRVDSPDEVFALKPRTDRKRASRCDLGTHRKARSCHHRGAISPLAISAEVDARMDEEAEAEAVAFEKQNGGPLGKAEQFDD